MERDRREYDDRAASGRIEDERWGPSERNPINWGRDRGALDRVADTVASWFGDEEAAERRRMDERVERRPDYDLAREEGESRERMRNSMLSRDVRRDPWGGPPAQDVGALPSGYYHDDARVRARDLGRAERGDYFTHPADEYSGGEYGLVNRAHAEMRSGREDSFRPEPGTEDYGFESPAARRDANRFTYAGRGPRNYRRSDERIAEEVNERLGEHGYVDASDVEVRVEEGEVTLSGAVATRQEKRLAEEVAATVRGVSDVRNSLRVR